MTPKMIPHFSYFVVCLTFIIFRCFMTKKKSETDDCRTNQWRIAVFVCDLEELTGQQLF